MVFKTLHNLIPPWLFNLNTVGDRRIRQTRSSNDLFLSRTNTNMGGRSFIIQGPSVWNKLPNSLREITNIHSFKTRLKQHLLTE